jgi:hypothetical protein
LPDTSELFWQLLTIGVAVAAGAVLVMGVVAFMAAIVSWFWHLWRFAPLQWRGHVASATISGCRRDGERRFVPLVDFVTAAGEARTSIAVRGARYTDPPLPIGQAFDVWQFKDEVFSWRADDTRSARSRAPPIGQGVAVVYDPADAQSASLRITRSLVIGLSVGAVLIALLWLAFSMPSISIAVAPWINGDTLGIVARLIFATTGFVPAFAAATSLLDYSRFWRLEKTGYVAPATAGFRWNADKVAYEPVLSFVTQAGQSRHKVLGTSFAYDRLPAREALTMVYDPDDETYAEVSYTRGTAPRPPINVLIGTCVALFTLLLLPPLMWGPDFRSVHISFATGLILGVIAATLRPTLAWTSGKSIR